MSGIGDEKMLIRPLHTHSDIGRLDQRRAGKIMDNLTT